MRTGTEIAVASRKQQAADQAMFRHLRIESAEQAVLALKSSVHFRADFGDLAGRIVVVEALGPSVADPAKLPFRNSGVVRLSPPPRDRLTSWAAASRLQALSDGAP